VSEFFSGSDFISIIFSTEVLFSAVFTLSLFIGMHALLTFMRKSTALYTRLAQIEAELNVLQASIPGKLERIRTIREDMAPLKQNFKMIQGYFSRLQHVERQWVEEQLAKEREEGEGKDKQIQRQRLGLDRFI